jgi:gamma-glutamylcyclotransferase (GGCT)/AIG2-like uncharacterized protein YtfP
MELLFVYGTLIGNSDLKIASLLNQNSTFICSGCFQGKLYDVGGYPGAVYLEGDVNKVFGNILKLDKPELVFASLDIYEEVGEQFPSPKYVRTKIPVTSANGEIMDCWVYQYSLSTENLEFIASGNYRKTNL